MKSSNILFSILALGLLLLAGCKSTTQQVETRTLSTFRLEQEIPPANTSAAAPQFGGYPKVTSALTVKQLVNKGYTVGYSEKLLNPLWVTYFCGPDIKFNSSRPDVKFATDKRVSANARLKHTDYNNPAGTQQIPDSYDRGHMAPSFAIGSRYGEQAQLETFTVTNICPQKSCLNRTTWEALEKRIASTYASESKGVWVIVGPIFPSDPVFYFEKPIHVPEAFFCIIADRKQNGKIDALAVVMEQTVSGIRPLKGLETTVDHIEELTGLDFFPDLDDSEEDLLESSLPGARWDLMSDLIPSRPVPDGCK